MVEQFRESILKNLVASDREIRFCCAGVVPIVSPKLSVGSTNAIRLPITKLSATQIIAAARQAPFGKGQETLVDQYVRNVWELLPHQFELRNADWDSVVEEIVDLIRKPMRLGNHDVSAHLYRLLVYEVGGFFLPHRDGEKQGGMVATLVITLPCKHAGGELIVRHERKEATLCALEAGWLRAINYTAFYADCEHEVRPLKKGFRVALVYNLSAKLNLERAAASVAEGTPAGLGNAFSEWPIGLSKAVIVLDPAPLSVAKVKPEELICTSAWDSVPPSREEVHGYLGNEGLTIDRWYHRAAMVVLRPKAKSKLPKAALEKTNTSARPRFVLVVRRCVVVIIAAAHHGTLRK